jgi:cephalosporin hydroxylase
MSKKEAPEITKFNRECEAKIEDYSKDDDWQKLSIDWLARGFEHKYMYNFKCLGRPIIQTPADMIAIQELIWETKPSLIIETGIAHGGSLIMSATLLAALDYCEAVENGQMLDPKATHRRVLGVDIDIRDHNRTAIEAHPMSHRIDMIEGSSIAPEIIDRVHKIAEYYETVLVLLDSNHTHKHVLAELEAYAPLTSIGSYCVVFDTVIEDLPDNTFPDRPWCKGNNSKTAVWEYLKTHPEMKIDKRFNDKLVINSSPDGYLKRVR